MTRAEKIRFWEAVDWSKPNCAISKETKMSAACVSSWRHILGKPKVTILAFRNTEILDRVQSGETYRSIGKVFGISRGRVEQIVNSERSSARVDSARLKRQVDCCQICGAPERLSKHHPNYLHPKMVIWVCRVCHKTADVLRRLREQSQLQPAA